MFLLNKIELIEKKNLLVQIIKFKKFLKSINVRISKLKQLKSLNSNKVNNLMFPNSKRKKDLITYIINFTLTSKDTLLFVTDIKGNLKYFQSAKALKVVGKQRIKQPIMLLKLLKTFSMSSNLLKNKSIGLHFVNIKKRFVILLTRILKKFLFVKIIRIYNFLIPHNGCRPKKIKRKKNFNLMFK